MRTGERIKTLRQQMNISADYLGEIIGKNRATIYRYENGSIDDIPISIIKKLADVFGVSACYLIGMEDQSDAIVLTQEERALVTAYRAANNQAREIALDTLLKYPRESQDQERFG